MRSPLRLAAVVAAAFVLVGGVAVFLLEQDSAFSPPKAVEAADHGEAIEASPPEIDRKSAPIAGPAIERPTKSTPEEPARAEAEESVGVDLALVDAMTKKPRDDATVWYIDPDADEVERGKYWHESDPLVEHFGIALDVDKEAHVVLPDLAEVEVVARAADRFGRASIHRSSGEHQRLLLWPDSPLRVRVVDAAGHPCGDLPVVLDVVSVSNQDPQRSRSPLLPPDPLGAGWSRFLQYARTLASAEQEGLWRGTTSKFDGDAEVPYGAQLLVAWADPDLVARTTALRFRLALPTTDAAMALVDPRMDLHEPVVLVAPPFVRLWVSVYGPDDRPYPYEVQLTSRLATTGPVVDPSDLIAIARMRVAASKQRKPLAADDASVRPKSPTGSAVSMGEKPVEMLVPAGASIEVEGMPTDVHFTADKATVTTPAGPDRFAEVSLRLTLKKNLAPSAAAPRVVGRAIDPDGRPLQDARIGGEVVDPYRPKPFHQPRFFVHADHRGVFTFPFPPPSHGSPTVAIRIFAPCPREDSGLGPTFGTLVELGGASRKSDLNLGDVKLDRLPLILSGRVVDRDGRGLSHPRIDLWAASSRPQDLPDATFLASRNGSFTIYGETEEKSLRVAADLVDWYAPGTTVDEHGWLVRPTRTVGVGTSDLVIELCRCGESRGEILLRPDVDPSAVSLVTLSRGATRVVREDGTRFRIVGIPGLCDLSALGSAGCRLALIDRIELREAVATDDSRLEPLDLTGVIRMPVRIVDPNGSPLPGAILALTSTSRESGIAPTFHADAFGREVVVAIRNFGPLIVMSPGLRLTRVPLEPIEKTITLSPGIHVTASLQGVTDVPPSVIATLTMQYMPPRSDVSTESTLLCGPPSRAADQALGNAKFELDLSAPGDYWVSVTLSDPATGKECYLDFEPHLLTVADVRESQQVELRVSDESLRRELQLLER